MSFVDRDIQDSYASASFVSYVSFSVLVLDSIQDSGSGVERRSGRKDKSLQ